MAAYIFLSRKLTFMYFMVMDKYIMKKEFVCEIKNEKGIIS